MPTLASEQLKAQLRQWRLRPRWEEERVFAIRTDLDYQGQPELDLDGLRLRVAACRSDLEARERLGELGGDEKEALVLLVRTGHGAIGEDIRCQFAGRQLLSLDQREVLREIFHATSVDPRIVGNPALLEALVDRGVEGIGRTAPGGSLDLDFAWSVLLRLPEVANHRPDLVDLLRWNRDPLKWAAVEALDVDLRPLFYGWVAERAGHVAGCLEHLAQTGRSDLFLPLGLVAGDLFAASLDADEMARSARVRLENYFGGIQLGARDGAAWLRAAGEVLKDAPKDQIERITGTVDEILTELRAGELAVHFAWSKRGFRDRWVAFADDLDRLGKRKWETGSAALRESLERLRGHALAALHPARMERAAMAVRLAVQAAREEFALGEPSRLAAAAAEFLAADSFIDWARFTLSHGDPVDQVSRVYGRIVQRAAKARIERQAAFGRMLRAWNDESGYLGGDLLTVEQVLDQVVAPLAKDKPVLLLVLDGMNAPVFHQLAGDLANYGWLPAAPAGQAVPRPVISALPSVTNVSRWALFAGRLGHGARLVEAVAFRDHKALGEVKSKGKPRLFAKADLGTSEHAGLAGGVREVLAGTEHRVVAVLLNAIDDQLATGGQLDVTWSVAGIGILPSILEAASLGERTLIVVSDHGHVLDLGASAQMRYDGVVEARCRPGREAKADEEVFAGERVRQATGQESLVLPVVETLRYTQKAGGYHGGATDLEVVIPLGVFTQADQAPAGCEFADLTVPAWWDWESVIGGVVAPAAPAARVPAIKPPAKRPGKKEQGTGELPLFEPEEAGVATGKPWQAALFQSSVYAAQVELLGRGAPKREHVEAVLGALAAHNGTILEAALARVIGQPSFRLQGILATVGRLLNVDGYEVISVDRDSKTIRLNERLLVKQFDLEA